MALSTYDILAEQGSDYLVTITYRDPNGALVNLTGYSARMQIRRTVSSDNAYLTLVSPGVISLGGSGGTIGITIPSATMSAIPAATYVYDLELVDGSGKVTKILKGDFVVNGEVTR